MTTNPVINKTFIYLLPMVGICLGIKRSQFTGFSGIFVKNDDYPDAENKILYLLFNDPGNYNNINSCRHTFDSACDKYYPDTSSTMYLFSVPDEYKREYNKFILSRYSEFSDNYKQSIIKFHDYRESINPRGTRDGSKILDILYKKEAAYQRQEEVINKDLPRADWTNIPRDQEIGKKWNENEEITLLETYTSDLKLQQIH